MTTTPASCSQPLFDAIDAGHWQFTGSDIDVKNELITRPQVGQVLCRLDLEPMPCTALRTARAACRPMLAPTGSRIATTPAMGLI
jgi:hypothetical protein